MKIQSIALFAVLVNPVSPDGQNSLSVGDIVPLFEGTADDGSVWKLNNFLGSKYIVVYFYPAAMTGGCTKQACAYRDHREELQSAGVEVIGVSGDKVENLKLFREAENLNFSLLSDENGKIAGIFGVPTGTGGVITRNVAGTDHQLERGVTTKRWTFIIDKKGTVVYKNDEVNAEKDTEEVLRFIQAHAAGSE